MMKKCFRQLCVACIAIVVCMGSAVVLQATPINFLDNIADDGTASTNGALFSTAGLEIENLIDEDLSPGGSGLVHGDGPGGSPGTPEAEGFAYFIDLGQSFDLLQVDIYPRQDTTSPEPLANFRVSIFSDNSGSIGVENWSVDLFTGGGNAGSAPVELIASSGTGTFSGQWIQILSLDTAAGGLGDFRLQINEVVVAAVVIPEPSSLALASLSLLGFPLFDRRKKR